MIVAHEHGGDPVRNCDIKDLSRGARVYFPVYVPGWIHLKVDLIKGGMAKYGIRNPIFKPSPIKLAYQACLNAIEYMTKFGYSRAQAYAILGTAPVQGHISGVVDIPNSCATLWLPTEIFDFDINPGASGPMQAIKSGVDIPLAPDL